MSVESGDSNQPLPEGFDSWNAYWATQGMHWRTEPEIGEERQRYLTERRAVSPDIEQGIYPFRDVILGRADVEWMLATHESGGCTGPIEWSDASQREREGLDVRGAHLSGVDLRGLPLARLRGGLNYEERVAALPRKPELAAVRLDGVDVSEAQLQHACLSRAHLEGAVLRGTYLSGADLFHARLEGAILTGAHLDSADLRFAFLDTATYLRGVILTAAETGSCWLAGIRWGGADLSLVHWSQLRELRDEQWARQPRDREGKPKPRATRVEESQFAVRANRKLSAVLRDQGLNEDADRYAYHAQVMQRAVLRLQRQWIRWAFSGVLDALAGHGYKPERTLFAYLTAIVGFAFTYFVLGQVVGPHLSPLGSVVFSMTSFHGRGFFPGGIALDDPITVVAAVEAFIGLIIEVSFIATFTQRFFAR